MKSAGFAGRLFTNYLGTLTLILALVACSAFYASARATVSPEIALGVLGAIGAALGIVVQAEQARQLEIDRKTHELRLQSFESNKEAYNELIAIFSAILIGTKAGQSDVEIDVNKAIALKNKLLVLASADTIRAWEMMSWPTKLPPTENQGVAKIRAAIPMTAYFRLMVSIRRDLGRDDGVDEVSVLRYMMNEHSSAMESNLAALTRISTYEDFLKFEARL